MYTRKPKGAKVASNPTEVSEWAVVDFHGDSLDVLRGFPEKVKDDLGYALEQLQRGQTPPDSKPMPGIASGVFELREQDERAWYRAIYYRKIKDVIHVLHCFEKRTNKTEQRDLDTAKHRLTRVLEEEREREREKKKHGKSSKGEKNPRIGKRSR